MFSKGFVTSEKLPCVVASFRASVCVVAPLLSKSTVVLTFLEPLWLYYQSITYYQSILVMTR